MPKTTLIDVAAALESWIGDDVPRADIGAKFISRHGLTNVPNAIFDAINKAPYENIVVDAVRHASSIRSIQEISSAPVFSIFVDSDEGLRLERLKSRFQSAGHSSSSIDDLMREYSVYDSQRVDAMLACDIKIVNNGSLDDLAHAAAGVVDSLAEQSRNP